MNEFLCPRCKTYTVSTTEIEGRQFAACSQCEWEAEFTHRDVDAEAGVVAKGMTKGCLWIIVGFIILLAIGAALPKIVQGFVESLPQQEERR